MKFCTVCETKLERENDILIDGVILVRGRKICSKCSKPVKEKLDEKITEECETLFHQYLVGMYGYTNEDKNKTWGQNISFYKLHYFEKILLDEGHSNIIIREMLLINSSVWIAAVKNEPIDIKNFKINRNKLVDGDRNKSITTTKGKSIKKWKKILVDRNTNLKYEIFMNTTSNLKKEIIKKKLLRARELQRSTNEPYKIIPFSTFIQWTNCKNTKKSLELDLTKITQLLNYHKYKIIFVKTNNIVAEHTKTKKYIFLNLIDSAKSNNLDINLDILGKLIMNLGKSTENKSKGVEGFGAWNQGAMTKYDWHASNNRKSRHNALKQRLFVEGFEKTFGTIKALLPVWRSPRNSKMHKHLPALKDDFHWLQTYPIQHQISKKRLSRKYKELQKNNEPLKNKKPSLMFFVNVSE
jgi:hypothetical protein